MESPLTERRVWYLNIRIRTAMFRELMNTLSFHVSERFVQKQKTLQRIGPS